MDCVTSSRPVTLISILNELFPFFHFLLKNLVLRYLYNYCSFWIQTLHMSSRSMEAVIPSRPITLSSILNKLSPFFATKILNLKYNFRYWSQTLHMYMQSLASHTIKVHHSVKHFFISYPPPFRFEFHYISNTIANIVFRL